MHDRFLRTNPLILSSYNITATIRSCDESMPGQVSELRFLHMNKITLAINGVSLCP